MASGRQIFIIFFVFFSCILWVSHGRATPQKPSIPVRAANLAGWLVIESITPSLFDGIPNNDLLDGTGLQLQSVKFGKYLSAKDVGGYITLVSNEAFLPTDGQIFKLWRISETIFNFRVFNKRFMGIDKGSHGSRTRLVASEVTPGSSETFEIVRKPDDLNRVRIKAANGFFLQTKTENLVTADFHGNGTWEDDDPSVFLLDMWERLNGEYQLTNGYGPRKAPQVMQEHWKSFITEKDFKFISKNGLNTVRIPVGWWIASDPNPPKPFVGGSLKFLDKAFSWAEKYGIKVIIDLHGAPGSQNGQENSGSRDGFSEWGQTDKNIQQTVAVVDFLSARYAKRSSLLAIELLNEPVAPGGSLATLIKYYKTGYNAVRKYNSTAYVILSNRLDSPNSTELFPLAGGFTKIVVDVHYYSLRDDFSLFTIPENINYIKTNRSEQLSQMIKPNGPLIFVGEWTAEWRVMGAEEWGYEAFAAVQKQVYERATFGWGYNPLRSINIHWSLEWMISNGHFKL